MCTFIHVHVLLLTDTFNFTQDGRLQKGDQLLQINEESVIHMRNEDVIAKLRSVSGGGYPVKLVIARLIREEEDPEDVHISDVHGSGEVMRFIVYILLRTVTYEEKKREGGTERGGGRDFEIIFFLPPVFR